MPRLYLEMQNNELKLLNENNQALAKNPILKDLASTEIIKINDYDTAIEVVFASGYILSINNPQVLVPMGTKEDAYVISIANKIMDCTSLEKKAIEEYKKRLPAGTTPRVNRRPKISSKTFVAGAAITVMIGLGIGALSAAAQADFKTNEMISTPEVTMEQPVAKSIPKEIKKFDSSMILAKIEEQQVVSNPVIELSFKDISDNGKRESTMDYCGDYINYYASRYGLSAEAICAQITQERPRINSDGVCKNPFQITYKYFVGRHMKVPVYDENGFTGTYDEFTITKEMLDSTEGNIMAGMGYVRECVDLSESLFTGVFLYNQGDPSLSAACRYYKLDLSDYKGDENTIAARDLIVKYHSELNELRGTPEKIHGDPNYLENVFRYMPMEEGQSTISYYLGEELKTIDLMNTYVYNMETELER